MPALHHIFLVPGFFGFTNLGDIVYFGHVRAYLSSLLTRRGIAAEIIPVVSHPTASIPNRAGDLLKAIEAHAMNDEGPIHLIGHSTGGLDCVYLASPTAGTQLGAVVDRIAPRIRTVTTVATPHRGTPLAAFFQGIAGRKLLQLLSLFTALVLRHGRLPLSLLFKVAGGVVRADDKLGFKQTLVDELFASLLADFSPERQATLLQFLGQMSQDSSLITQLTPGAMSAFVSQMRLRPSVRYASVVTKAAGPRLRAFLKAGVNPYAHATHALYSFLHGRSEGLALTIEPAHEQFLKRAYGKAPNGKDSDGIVPTLSQPFAEVLLAVNADHLDVLGHYDGEDEVPPHIDWLVSGSGFERRHFEQIWSKLLDFILRSP